MRARRALGPERDRLWQRWVATDPRLDAYAVRRSTETPVIEAALKLHGGKPIINSINFEDGEKAAEDRLILENLKRLRRSKIKVMGGELFHIEIPPGKGREQAMRTATDEIMCRIAVLLPENYRGVYAQHARLKELLGSEG